MRESQVVKEWVSKGRAEGELGYQRQNVLLLLEARFPGVISSDGVKRIEQQTSIDQLKDWFHEGLRAPSFEHFSRILWEIPRANPA